MWESVIVVLQWLSKYRLVPVRKHVTYVHYWLGALLLAPPLNIESDFRWYDCTVLLEVTTNKCAITYLCIYSKINSRGRWLAWYPSRLYRWLPHLLPRAISVEWPDNADSKWTQNLKKYYRIKIKSCNITIRSSWSTFSFVIFISDRAFSDVCTIK